MVTSIQPPPAGVARPIVVIGAGAGGLAAALSLAAHGWPVTVIERRPEVGGKMRSADSTAGPIDVGPTVFTMRWVFERLLEMADRDVASVLDPEPLRRLAHHRWPDGGRLDLYAEPAHNLDAVAEFAGSDEAMRFARFLDAARRCHDTLLDPFLQRDQPGLVGLLRDLSPGEWFGLARSGPLDTLWKRLGRYFRDPRLRQLYARYATYCGCSPFAAPATLMLIAHVEQRGVWRLPGGMTSLARALAEAATDLGATFIHGREVVEIAVSGGRVCGVRLDDGSRLPASATICNADTQALCEGRLGDAVRSAVPAEPPSRRSLSALTWSGCARVTGTGLDHHNVFFSADYGREFGQLAAGEVPDPPTVYLCLPDRPGSAEGGTERAFALVNAPPDGDDAAIDHAARAERAWTAAARQLRRCEVSLTWEEPGPRVATPADFAVDYPGRGGAIYGAAVHGWNAAFRRPGNRSGVPGLYLAGGSVHPGAGVPMAALSGIAAARCLGEDLGQAVAAAS